MTDEVGVELCGALKHVVAIAAGIADGLHLGDNTKAAILRLGFWEMFELMKVLFPNRGELDVSDVFNNIHQFDENNFRPGGITSMFLTVSRQDPLLKVALWCFGKDDN